MKRAKRANPLVVFMQVICCLIICGIINQIVGVVCSLLVCGRFTIALALFTMLTLFSSPLCQGRRKQIKSGEAISSLLGGSGGMPPQENFAFLRWFLSQFQQNVSVDK